MNHLGQWTRGLRGKLLLLSVVPILIFGGLVFVLDTTIGSLISGLEKTNTEEIPKIEHAISAEYYLANSDRLFWISYDSRENPEAFREAVSQTTESMVSAKKHFEAVGVLPLAPHIQNRFDKLGTQINAYEKVVAEQLALINQRTEEGFSKARQLNGSQTRPLLREIETDLGAMVDDIKEYVRTNSTERVEEAVQAEIWTSIAAIAVFFAVFFVGILFSGVLAKNLAALADELSGSGSQVASASEQLSAASQTLSSGASEAASSLQETVSSIEELSSMVKQNAENAREAGTLSSSASSSADEGEKEVKQLIVAMKDIGESSKKIEDIITTIDDIAFQTNLLALNAAVEAARAGDQGKGFAVVAEAVRSLAQRSSSAAKDITALIKDSVSKVENGAKVADKSGEVLKNIVVSVKKVADLNSEISSASQEQAEGISQISKAMNQLDQATQSNAASAEEAASASEELSAEAVTLSRMVNDLKSIVDGHKKDGVLEAAVNQKRQPSFSNSSRSHSGSRPASHQVKLKSFGKSSASDMIPFDEEETAKKIGTLDGF
jgi:ABC-type transporter Mla subunit MlaD